MSTHERATGANCDPKTDRKANAIDASSAFDSTTNFESVGTIIERFIRPGRVIRLYRCFVCKRCYTVSRMSGLLVLCRVCLDATREKGERARANQIDRIGREIRTFLKGRLQSR